MTQTHFPGVGDCGAETPVERSASRVLNKESLVETKPERQCGFGNTKNRFDYTGVHPSLINKSITFKYPKLGPGVYNATRWECKYKKYTGPYNWTRKLELEEFSRWGARNMAEKLEKQANLGPATYTIPKELYQKKSSSFKANISFGHSARFKSPRSNAPPPGVYFKNILKDTPTKKHTFSTLPHFEWSGFGDRFRSDEKNYKLAPNRYHVKDGKGIDALLQKKVSHLRSPYDVSSGPRDYSTIKNHFSEPKKITPDVNFIQPSDLDFLLHDRSKASYGKFLKSERFPKHSGIRMLMASLSNCYKDPDDPGPGHYNIAKSEYEKASRSFPMNSAPTAYGKLPWNLFPGPGRYSQNLYQKKACQRRLKGPSCTFKSQTPRFKEIEDPFMFQ